MSDDHHLDDPGIPLPTIDREPPGADWPTAGLDDAVDRARLDALFDEAFGDEDHPRTRLTLAAVVIHRGRLVAERYSSTADADTTLVSWSMAKSVTAAMIGLLVGDGRLDLDAPAPVPGWDDERSAITIRHLLTMTSGLAWREDYVDGEASDVIEMLFGTGQHDVDGFASALPTTAAPDEVFCYSSGTTNILAGIVRRTLGGEAATRAFLDERLFGPLGMTSADPRFDETGTFIGSSFLYATARDFARFGELHLRDGVWHDRILPEGWVDSVRAPIPQAVPEKNHYGRQWWLWRDEPGVFGCHGYEGQFIGVDPRRDLVAVRLGKTPEPNTAEGRHWLRDVMRCFPTLGA